ncbi:MAG TPA: bifunctional diguanylate cyclase/phosphodiesterase, partial [Mycoplana sp.]|nr:bifunctional diguanylate cyclase/phosphodiesterase [Mycoplana sp.]
QDALHDNLTGLPNRQVFLDRLQSVLSIAGSSETVRPTVLAIDIDRYKQVNDALGIAAGDNILVALSRRLRRILKPQDTLARLSGDQFGLILLSERDPAKVADFADAVSKAITVPINFANREIILTASIGLVSCLDPQQDAASLLNDAELAMYRAKKAGGNRVEPFRPAFRSMGTDRLQMETDLRRAIDRKELSLVYQPIVRLSDAEIAGFEALMRWEHPKRGSISPEEFIPVAEQSGLISQLGAFAFDKAASDLMDWQLQTGDLPIFVSVNLSSAQLLNNELYNDVRAVLSKTRCEPHKLKFELTESVVMENAEQARLVLNKLREVGLGLALDDFGTGYSSLAYLTRFPFDTIKIDKALVRDSSDKRTVLLRSVISMALEMEMQVVAEGIETEEDAIELGRMGCQFGQSYLFGPPIGCDSVLRLLKERFPLMKRA